MAQDLRGKVKDENGQALPGVNIIIKVQLTGVITNLDGEYSITAPADATLVFSYVGYQRKEIPVENRNVIDVEIVPDAYALNEVVAVGYGSMKKSRSYRIGCVGK